MSSIALSCFAKRSKAWTNSVSGEGNASSGLLEFLCSRTEVPWLPSWMPHIMQSSYFFCPRLYLRCRIVKSPCVATYGTPQDASSGPGSELNVGSHMSLKLSAGSQGRETLFPELSISSHGCRRSCPDENFSNPIAYAPVVLDGLVAVCIR